MNLYFKIILVLLISSTITSCIFFSNQITIMDYPTKLSNKKDTITVKFVAWACDCPNWLETMENSNEEEVTPKSCIYIEQGKVSINDLRTNIESLSTLKLVGSYYEDVGISRDYVSSTPEKPIYSKVFKYDKILEMQ